MFNQLAMSILYDLPPECILNDTHPFPYDDVMLDIRLKKHFTLIAIKTLCVLT